jgi:hypothetical protein
MAIDLELLMSSVEAARENSYGTDETSALGQRRAQAIEAYLGLNTNPAPEGRSQVVDRTVYQTINTLLPSLVRIFASQSESVCKLVPVGPDDEAAAEQSTAVLNHVVVDQNPWEQICHDWMMDAMLGMNGYVMAYWDESQNRVREVYEGQSEDQMAALLSDKDVSVIQHSQTIDKQATADLQKQYEMALQQWNVAMQQIKIARQQGNDIAIPQKPLPPQQVFLHDLVIERSENTGKVCISVLPQEHCYVSIDTPSWMLSDCPYFEFRQEKTIADLRAMGLDVPEDISDDESSDPTAEDWSRDRFGENRVDDEKGVMRRVWARMIWIRGDFEGDGISRLYYAIAVGNRALFAQPAGRIPVSSMTFHPLPHRHVGMGEAESILDIQNIKTAVKRGGLDNLYLANNGRHIISSRVNMNDFLDARPGGVVRMLDDSLPSEGHVMPLTHPMAFDTIIGSLEYFDQDAQNRSGASRYFSGTDAGAINRTASGTVALQNMASMRVEHLARVMAPAVEELFGIVQELIAKHENKALTLKLNGSWVLVDPQNWRKKRDVRISVGVGAGNKESLQQVLGNIFAAQMQLLPMGVAQPANLYETVMEMTKLAGFANPDKFWTNPRQNPQPMPPSPEQIKSQSQMQIEQIKIQADAQKFQAEQELEKQKLMLQAEVDKQREEMQARQKLLEAQSKAELERQKAAMDAAQTQQRLEFEKWRAELEAAVKLQIAGMGDQTQRDLHKPDESVSSGIEGVMDMLKEMAEYISAPAEIVRDPNTGRATGVRRGKVERSIVRGPDGRAVGLQ